MGRLLWLQDQSRWADVWGRATVVAAAVVVGVAAEEGAIVVVLAVVHLYQWEGVVEWGVVGEMDELIAPRSGLVFWIGFGFSSKFDLPIGAISYLTSFFHDVFHD